MKKFLLFFILGFCCANLEAQFAPDSNVIMTFKNTSYDFGEIVQGTEIEKDFPFTNTGKSPLIIYDIKSGVTLASFNREPIAPGKSGIVHVLYSSEGRMGIQDKSLMIESNNRDGIILLYMKGNVIAPPVDPNAAVMTFDSLIFNFGEIMQGKNVVHDFHFKNTGKSPLIIEYVSCPGPMQPNYSREPVAPGKSGIITLLYSTESKVGQQHRTVTVHSNNGNGDIVLALNGTVILPAPAMKFDSTSYSFGKVKRGERVDLELHFINAGKEPLIIMNCTTTCGCDVASAPREPIPPGGSGVVKYTLDTTARMGPQSKSITITYNTDHVQVITINGEIIAP